VLPVSALAFQIVRHRRAFVNVLQCRMESSWPPHRVKALRSALRENTAAFAVRFARSPRTIEDWELGRRKPDALCRRILDVIAVQFPLDGQNGAAV
jgi:DNA-binding transcriptional regulator YiaG